MKVKEYFCMVVGAIGGAVSMAFGGWDAALLTLLVCMAIDFATGWIVAGVFHASKKSKGGGLESGACWKGLARKVMTLLLVVVANLMDKVMGVHYLRDTVIIGFIANEVLSILENAGIMGLPVPKILMKAIDVLQGKAQAEADRIPDGWDSAEHVGAGLAPAREHVAEFEAVESERKGTEAAEPVEEKRAMASIAPTAGTEEPEDGRTRRSAPTEQNENGPESEGVSTAGTEEPEGDRV